MVQYSGTGTTDLIYISDMLYLSLNRIEVCLNYISTIFSMEFWLNFSKKI